MEAVKGELFLSLIIFQKKLRNLITNEELLRDNARYERKDKPYSAHWLTPGTLEIMLFVRQTRGHGERYRVNGY